MKKIWNVAQTEFSNSVRSKAFIIGVLAMPVMFVLMGVMQKFALEKKDLTERRFAVVDYSGELFPVIHAAIKKRSEPSQGDITPFAVEHIEGQSDHDLQVLELSDRIRENKLFAFVVIEKGILSSTSKPEDFRYYTNSPTFRDLPEWIENVVHAELQRRRFGEAGLDPVRVTNLMKRVPLQRLGLARRDVGGGIEEGKKDDEIRSFVVPMATMLLLFILLMTSVPMLLTTVMEEKINRISEFLVSAVSPFKLLMGKLIGVLMVSLIYLASLAGVASRYGLGDVITLEKIAWFYLFLILGGLMLGSVCVAIGAACNEIRDSQSLMFPVMMITMFPLLVWMPVIESPDGNFARILSLIPPFTPLLMLLRISVPPGVEWWELLLGVVLTTGFSVLCVMAAGKIFRIGILSQGQTPSLALLVRWLMAK